MRQVIASEFPTLDGVVEAPGGETSHRHAGWTTPHAADDLFAFKLKETRGADSRLHVYPVVVGGGARIFPHDRSRWASEAAGLQRFSSDAVLHVYRPARS